MAFKLEALLKLRKNQENEELKRFAEVNSHLVRQKDRLRFVEEVEKRNFQSLDEQMLQNPDANVLWLYNNFFEGSRHQEQRSRMVISEVEEKLEFRRKDLAEAMRKRKTLELLKEKEAEALRKKRMKQEWDQLDESASNLWRRTRR